MSKYLKYDTNNNRTDSIWMLGMVTICVYLAASFPGTRIFGSFPIQRLSLYLFLAEGVTLYFFNRENTLISSYMIWYGLFMIISMLSLLLSGGSITHGGFYSIITCFILAVFLTLYVTKENAINVICWSYVIICAANTFVLILTGELKLDTGERLGTDIDINPNTLAMFLMYGEIYALWLYCFEKKRSTKCILLSLAVLIMYPLILTGGRKFFAVPIIFLCIILMLRKNIAGNSNKLRSLIIICAIIFIAWQMIMNIPALYNSLGNRMEGLISSITGEGKVDYSTKIRNELKALAIKGWLEKPIWGFGFDRFKYFSLSNGLPLAYSHCNMTELLFNGGVISFIIYYWFYAYVLLNGIKNKGLSERFRALCIAGVIAQFIFDYGGVTYNVFESQLFVLLIFCSVYKIENQTKKVAMHKYII